MANVVDKKGKLLEDKCITSVRNKPITVSADVINSLLFIENPPSVPDIRYDKEKFFKTLVPHKTYRGVLKLSPNDMSPAYRALWYIYSRNLVQKSKNYTYFNSTDYGLFASLINKVPFNIGHWVYQEMKRFRFELGSSAPIPYPNLVSLLLYTNKIWYLDTTNEPPVKPQMFSQIHLNYMNITFQEGSGQSRAPSRSRASVSRPLEAESSPGPSQSQHAPPPSGLSAEIKNIISKAMQETFGTLQTTLTAQYYELSDRSEEHNV